MPAPRTEIRGGTRVKDLAYATYAARAYVLLIASLPTFPQTANSSQPEGTISGTVLDENGQPFKGVQVCTWMRDAPAGSRESRGECAAAPTDDVGQFRIDHVAMGEIVVEAIKPEMATSLSLAPA